METDTVAFAVLNHADKARITNIGFGHIAISTNVLKNKPMPRPSRNLRPEFCYYVTVRCNIRLTRLECREVLLYAIKRCQEKYGFKLYALCMMSNHFG